MNIIIGFILYMLGVSTAFAALILFSFFEQTREGFELWKQKREELIKRNKINKA